MLMFDDHHDLFLNKTHARTVTGNDEQKRDVNPGLAWVDFAVGTWLSSPPGRVNHFAFCLPGQSDPQVVTFGL